MKHTIKELQTLKDDLYYSCHKNEERINWIIKEITIEKIHSIRIPIYYSLDDDGNKIYDIQGMVEVFEKKLSKITKRKISLWA